MQCLANALAPEETAEQWELQGLRVLWDRQEAKDILAMRADLERGVLPVSMELRVSRGVLDKGVSRVLVGTREKRENLEK